MSENKKIFGDYQTPLDFARRVCELIRESYCAAPDVIIEPTCGVGNFLVAAHERFGGEQFSGEIFGCDVNADYVQVARERLPRFAENIFYNDTLKNGLKNRISVKPHSEILIVGNPPWVTSAGVSKMGGKNLPQKQNLKKLNGLESKMGAANFDICESIILSLINEFAGDNIVCGMLCKEIVARNVFEWLAQNSIKCTQIRIYKINAQQIFNVFADACLFVFRLTTDSECAKECEVFAFDTPTERISTLRYANGRLYANFDVQIQELDGECCFEWRQGVKHDCAGVLELKKNSKFYTNKGKEIVILEDTFLYPLVKSSDIKQIKTNKTERVIIITQQKPKDDTTKIKQFAPQTWDYLSRHKDKFTKRKSIIYANSPDFSMFGVGDYAFKKYKVAVSGFYKTPLFSLVYSDKAVMLDDTCYFLGFDDFDCAYALTLLLNSEPAQRFFASIAFLGSKRPYTKRVLQRINVQKLAANVDFNALQDVERRLANEPYLTREIYVKFTNFIASAHNLGALF